jgi:hypothetical protein
MSGTIWAKFMLIGNAKLVFSDTVAITSQPPHEKHWGHEHRGRPEADPLDPLFDPLFQLDAAGAADSEEDDDAQGKVRKKRVGGKVVQQPRWLILRAANKRKGQTLMSCQFGLHCWMHQEGPDGSKIRVSRGSMYRQHAYAACIGSMYRQYV